MLGFRYYVEALNDQKVQLLAPELFTFWVNCLSVARQNNGLLPDVAGLAFQLRMETPKAQAVVQDLITGGLLDRTAHGLSPHNWSTRQYQSATSTARVRLYRGNHCVGTFLQRSTERGSPVAVVGLSQLLKHRRTRWQTGWGGQ
jgi:hypothetical protein